MGCFLRPILISFHSFPSTNAPCIGCFQLVQICSILVHAFNQRTLYGVLRSDVKGTKPQETFNQRTQYGVLHDFFAFYSYHYFPSTNAPHTGVLPKMTSSLLPWMLFNQRTPYGGASCDVVYLDLEGSPSTNAPSIWCFELIDDLILDQILQPTHPVWGASTAKVNQENLQPTHPVWGASVPFCKKVS